MSLWVRMGWNFCKYPKFFTQISICLDYNLWFSEILLFADFILRSLKIFKILLKLYSVVCLAYPCLVLFRYLLFWSVFGFYGSKSTRGVHIMWNRRKLSTDLICSLLLCLISFTNWYMWYQNNQQNISLD